MCSVLPQHVTECTSVRLYLFGAVTECRSVYSNTLRAMSGRLFLTFPLYHRRNADLVVTG